MIMRFYNLKYWKIKYSFILMLCILLTGTVYSQTGKNQNTTTATVNIKVIDENGKGIPKAQVVVGEGKIHAETDNLGSLSLNASPEDVVSINVQGYDENVTTIKEIIQNSTITLIKAKLFASSADEVPLPFTTIKKRLITGSENVLTTSQLEKYPSTDLRNAFTGLIPGVEVRELNGSPGLAAEEGNGTYGTSDKIRVTARGTDMIFIVDDMPIDITEMPLDPQEIESVTIVKDIVGKTMYGPLGANGIILIKTKQGKKNERLLNVNVEQGVSSIDRMPEWVSGGIYARMNNLARKNDGLTPNYTSNDIAAYTKNDPYDKYHPGINFRDLMLKNSMSFKRANFSSSGGNDIIRYSAYVGYNGEGDIYKIGKQADYNRINARSIVDIKVNDYVSAQINVYAGLTFRRSPNYGYDSDYSSDDVNVNPVLSLSELPSILEDINSTPPIAFPVYASYDSQTNIPWFGVSSKYSVNPIGSLTNNGYYTDRGRTGAAKITFEYNMGHLVKGLKSKTFISYNGLDLIRIGKAEDYLAYIATPGTTAGGNDTILLSKVHNGVDMSGLAKLHDYYYQRVSASENLSYSRSFGVNEIQTDLTYFLYKISKNGFGEPRRMQSIALSGTYSFDKKYIISGVLNYAGTYSFMKNERSKLFPSVGAGWIISDETFMSSLKFIDFLKLRTEFGILGNESFLDEILFRSNWTANTSGSAFGPYSTNPWFGTTNDNTVYRTNSDRIGNPLLTWEKRKEFSAGFDALILNQKLSMELTYYNIVREGEITQLLNSTPYAVGISASLPHFNYNNTRYFGLEAGLQYKEVKGDFAYSLGINATVQNSKRLKYDEPNYREQYQLRTGKPVDAYFGQTYIGSFTSDAETEIVPQLFDAELHAGDLKYKDMNGDNFIDEGDQSMIGHTTPRLFYAINGQIKFKDFDLTIVGTGRAFYDLPLTNKWFWNGWGDDNYSTFVQKNAGVGYPKLTYYKVNNNFVGSNFWLAKGGFFKIQNVEIGYNLPSSVNNIIKARNLRLFVRGANLLTVSKIKDVDPESINSGVDNYPLFKTVSGGIKLTF
jgi:TonB-linked SusC/RagA family outer membrane protein